MRIANSCHPVAMALHAIIGKDQVYPHLRSIPDAICQGYSTQGQSALCLVFSPQGSRNRGATVTYPQGYAHLVPPFWRACLPGKEQVRYRSLHQLRCTASRRENDGNIGHLQIRHQRSNTLASARGRLPARTASGSGAMCDGNVRR